MVGWLFCGLLHCPLWVLVPTGPLHLPSHFSRFLTRRDLERIQLEEHDGTRGFGHGVADRASHSLHWPALAPPAPALGLQRMLSCLQVKGMGNIG